MKLFKKNPTISKPARSDSEWDARYRHGKLMEARTAWIVAGIFLVLLVETRLEFIFLEPKVIKEAVPFAYDQQKGTYQQMTSLDSKQVITPSNAMTRANLQTFVEAREVYDYYNLNRPFLQVKSMAAGTVAAEYQNIYLGQKPLDKTLKDSVRIVIDVTYVSPTGGNTRSVHFTKTLFAGGKATPTNHVATLTWDYDSKIELEDDERLVNPLGFQVHYYIVEADIGGNL